jgi:hypothetical protein
MSAESVTQENIKFNRYGLRWKGIARTRHRLCTTRIGDAKEMLQENLLLGMVPIPKDDSELLVIRVHFCRRMEYERCSKAVGILA